MMKRLNGVVIILSFIFVVTPAIAQNQMNDQLIASIEQLSDYNSGLDDFAKVSQSESLNIDQIQTSFNNQMAENNHLAMAQNIQNENSTVEFIVQEQNIIQITGDDGANHLVKEGVGINGNEAYLVQETNGQGINTANIIQEGGNNLLSGASLSNGVATMGSGSAQQISAGGNNTLVLHQAGSDSVYLYQNAVSHNTAIIDQTGLSSDTAIIYQQGTGVNYMNISQTGHGANFAQVTQFGTNNYATISQ